MKTPLFLVVLLTACGARSVDGPIEHTPPASTPASETGVVATSSSELLRTEAEPCAFGASAGHLVWIDAATHRVNVARAVPGSTAKAFGTAASTCALSVSGTRFCFGDSDGSLTCWNVDGSDYAIHGERRPTDPVRTVDFGLDGGLMFGRRRAVYGRLYHEERFETRTTFDDVVAVAGDFNPSPDDGVELGYATVTQLRRIGFGEDRPVPIVTTVAVRALHYSAYLLLGSDGILRTAHLSEGAGTELSLGGAVHAMAYIDRYQGENLLVARDGDIVAAHGELFFAAKVTGLRVVAPSEGEVVSLAIDEHDVLWATRAGEIRRAKRKIE